MVDDFVLIELKWKSEIFQILNESKHFPFSILNYMEMQETCAFKNCSDLDLEAETKGRTA